MADLVLKDTMAFLGMRGADITAAFQLRTVIRRGVPATSVERMAKELEIPAMSAVELLGLAKRTYARRLHDRKLLSTEDSERVVRLARAMAEAVHVLGDMGKARRWMLKESRALGGEKPLHLLDTDVGADAVFAELGRIEYGVFA